jgi:hypothetical protein
MKPNSSLSEKISLFLFFAWRQGKNFARPNHKKSLKKRLYLETHQLHLIADPTEVERYNCDSARFSHI